MFLLPACAVSAETWQFRLRCPKPLLQNPSRRNGDDGWSDYSLTSRARQPSLQSSFSSNVVALCVCLSASSGVHGICQSPVDSYRKEPAGQVEVQSILNAGYDNDAMRADRLRRRAVASSGFSKSVRGRTTETHPEVNCKKAAAPSPPSCFADFGSRRQIGFLMEFAVPTMQDDQILPTCRNAPTATPGL
jgi:hypothetical protein